MRLPIVRHSNLGPILHRFRDNAGFCAPDPTPRLFHPNFGDVPVALYRPCWGQPMHFGFKLPSEIIPTRIDKIYV